MGKPIHGKIVAAKFRTTVKKEAAALFDAYGIHPGLAIIQVGNEPLSQLYTQIQLQACSDMDFHVSEYKMNNNATTEQLLDLIGVLNKDPKIHGILVQLPLPELIDTKRVLASIAVQKDVDAYSPYSMGCLMEGKPGLLPCTPAGILELIESTGVSLSGKHCVIIGRSNLVGKPLAMLLLQKDATVTICHSKTDQLQSICKEADILISAVGKPHVVTADMVKEQAIVIDVGLYQMEDGSLCGDVEYDAVAERASYLTPVPGGVGPMTVAMLLKNTLSAARQSKEKK